MRRHWSFGDAARAQALDAAVRERSAERIRAFVALPDERALDQAAKRIRDFGIPGGGEGFNDTGATSQRVGIPQSKRGRVIGKGGSTRLAIEAQSGARVVLRESEDCLLLGQPEQVQEAARIILELVS
ncbi:unnamed protein product [Prorocentrum cordatum]|uniref:K Homology domain-containing protein n=1 Tax=Prorocentrum cordatum TaxID=2364126 RepID=A0ABN9VV15_9DINO|nr:unnamed protein product [Polarella glacialis]